MIQSMAIRSVDELLRQSIQPLKPREKLSRSDWAERHFQVTKGSSTGNWKTRPYQKEILDAWDDPRIWRTSIMKSSRVGATTLLNIDECYSIHWEPCDTCTVQPTTGDAEKYSRDTFNSLIDNVDVLKDMFAVCKHRDGTNSILEKYINGASLKFLGANSPNGFRRVTYRIVRADETSAYKAGGAGKEGDQIELLLNRTIDYHDRLFIDCSTPTIEGFDRIDDAFKLGDQRHRYLPCPHCGWYQQLSATAFTPGADRSKPGGFWWEPGKPTSVVYICERCDKPIQHSQKFEMDLHGEWRPSAPPNIDPNGREHRSYHIWAGISYQANASWANIVAEHEKNQNSPEKVQVFINTWLGLPYREDAATRLTAEGLMTRRDDYPSGKVPDGVLMICIGVDMQDDRAEVFIWGFGPGDSAAQATAEPEKWLIEHHVIYERYDTKAVYAQLDTFLLGTYPLGNGSELKPAAMAVDSGSGDHTPYVYEYANSRSRQGVIAIKGMPQIGKPPINNGRRTEYDMKGRLKKTSAQVYQVGTDMIKTILMAQLRHGLQSGAGAIHFPNDTTEEFFVQLVSERRHHSTVGGQPKVTWVRRKGTAAEALDGTVYAYAAFHHAKKKFNQKTMWAQLKAAARGGDKPATEKSPVAFNLLEGQRVY
jgi:phage terminase large subunit GpA-like protein